MKGTALLLWLIVALLSRTLLAEEAPPRTLSAVRVDSKTKPVIDGELNEACWQIAPKTTPFWTADGSRQVKRTAQVQIAHDDEHIFVAFRAPFDGVASAAQAHVFIDPFLEHQRKHGLSEDWTRRFYFRRDPRLFRFSVDVSNGRSSDLIGVDWYRVPWESGTHVHLGQIDNKSDDVWTAELAIPLASLAYFEMETGEEDRWTEQWGFNFGYRETRWVSDFTPEKQTIPLRHYNARVDAGGYPLRYGLVTDLQVDETPHRWNYLLDAHTGDLKIGPRVIGSTKVLLTLNNFTDQRRQVKIVARQIAADGTTLRSPYESSFEIEIRSKAEKGVFWGHGSLELPIKTPGLHALLLSVIDADSNKPLSHRPLLIDPVEIGYGVWDRSFYMRKPTARLTVHVDGQLSLGTWVRCDLRPKGRETTLDSITTHWQKSSTNGPYTTQAKFDLGSLPYGDYVVTATIDGYEDHPFDVPLLRKLPNKPGAVQYTDSGALLRDGQPIFPTAFFYVKNHLRLEPDFRQEYADAGFTSYMLEWMGPAGFIETSRRMAEVGLYPILGAQKFGYEVTQWDERGDYSWESLVRGRFPMLRKAVSMVTSMSQENILAWMTRDEPNENMYNLVQGYHEILRELDPYHPTYVPLVTGRLCAAYRYAVDIPGPYIYPNFPGGDVSMAGERTARAVRDMPGHPVMPVLQTFIPIDWNTGKHRVGNRQPNRSELRCMAFHSIINGATGFTFFSYFHGGPQKDVFPDAWANAKELAGHLKTLTPILLSPPPSETAPELKLVTEDREGVQARLYALDGSIFVVAVNHEEPPLKEVKFSVRSKKSAAPFDSAVKVWFEDRSVRANNAAWVDDFGPYGVHIYELRRR